MELILLLILIMLVLSIQNQQYVYVDYNGSVYSITLHTFKALIKQNRMSSIVEYDKELGLPVILPYNYYNPLEDMPSLQHITFKDQLLDYWSFAYGLCLETWLRIKEYLK